ncbi:MAG: DUF1573 domain-containing protein [bacterium]|nr:DUF1573 domain-containing protein [bacterium]
MVRFLTLTLTLLVVSFTLVFAQAAKLEVVGGDTYDWGKVKPPKEGHLDATIKMKNTGGRELKLIEIRPGCGCTKTDPDKMDVTSGDVSTMGVKLNINPSQSGQIVKSITVRWGDKEGIAARDEFRKSGTAVPAGLDTNESTSFVTLKADIQRALVLGPNQYFNFSELKIGQEATSTLFLSNNDTQPITVSDFVTDGGLVVNITDKRVINPGEKLEIVARIVPQMKGQVTGGLKFMTSTPEMPTMDIRAYGNVPEPTSPVFPKGVK